MQGRIRTIHLDVAMRNEIYPFLQDKWYQRTDNHHFRELQRKQCLWDLLEIAAGVRK